MKTIPAKTLINNTGYPDYWFGNDYNMNIYRGCNQGCIYCDSRSLCYGNFDFDNIVVKENAVGIIEKQLASKRKKGIVGTGAMSDPYNSYELKEKATEKALELINRYGFGVGICTKNKNVCRDIDILKKIAVHSPVTVCVTITAHDDAIASKIEPGASSSEERFRALAELSRAGVYCGVLMMPMMTHITDTEENINGITEKATEAGVDFIYPSFGFTMRDGNREYLYNKLDILFPGIKNEYEKLYGLSYSCSVPNAKNLSGLFEQHCEGYKIKYRMSEIISGASERVRNKQTTMF